MQYNKQEITQAIIIVIIPFLVLGGCTVGLYFAIRAYLATHYARVIGLNCDINNFGPGYICETEITCPVNTISSIPLPFQPIPLEFFQFCCQQPGNYSSRLTALGDICNADVRMMMGYLTQFVSSSLLGDVEPCLDNQSSSRKFLLILAMCFAAIFALCAVCLYIPAGKNMCTFLKTCCSTKSDVEHRPLLSTESGNSSTPQSPL